MTVISTKPEISHESAGRAMWLHIPETATRCAQSKAFLSPNHKSAQEGI